MLLTPTPASPAPARPRCTVLCVDDEPNILSALERLLRRSGVRLLTAGGGHEALTVMAREPVDVLVSDMRMPEMDGAQLLAAARERWPDTVRLLLTGHADHEATVRAINRGRVFAYLHKPWDAEELVATVSRAGEMALLAREKTRLEALTRAQNEELQALNDSLAQRVEERTAALALAHGKLKRNYMTSIKVFANLMELRSGSLMGHGRRVGEQARQIARAMGCADEQVQRIFIAGLLHDIGLIGMSDHALARPPARLEPDQQALYRRHCALGEQSLLALDDLQPVANLIRQHHERFDGKGFPDALAGGDIDLGARILAVCDQHDELLSGAFGTPGLPLAEVQAQLQRGRGTLFDPQVLDALLQLGQQPAPAAAVPAVALRWDRLRPGMVLAADLLSREGVLLLSAEHVLTEDMVRRIGDHARREGVAVVLQICVPPGAAAAAAKPVAPAAPTAVAAA